MTMTDDNETAAAPLREKIREQAEGKAANAASDQGATHLAAAWSPTGVPASPATIDADLWPGVAQPPSGAKAAVAGKAAGSSSRAAVKRLPLEGGISGRHRPGPGRPGCAP
jgi:cyclopropane-fatty-acyl-phospholipid synthase